MNLRANVSLSRSMADNLAKQIEEGILSAGTKLPSIREYAEASGCSKNTVISAFEMLTSNGLIEPRRGSGFYVARRVRAATEVDEAGVLDRAMDTVWLMREQLQIKPDVLNLGEGFPPVDWLEATRLDQYHQRIVRTGVASLFRYGSRYGYLPLRQSLQQKLSGYEIDAPPSQQNRSKSRGLLTPITAAHECVVAGGCEHKVTECAANEEECDQRRDHGRFASSTAARKSDVGEPGP